MNKRENIVPNNLKGFRLKAGLTQNQVVERLGLQCEDRLSHWEKGKAMPNVINLLKLAKIYDVLPDKLYSPKETI